VAGDFGGQFTDGGAQIVQTSLQQHLSAQQKPMLLAELDVIVQHELQRPLDAIQALAHGGPSIVILARGADDVWLVFLPPGVRREATTTSRKGIAAPRPLTPTE